MKHVKTNALAAAVALYPCQPRLLYLQPNAAVSYRKVTK